MGDLQTAAGDIPHSGEALIGAGILPMAPGPYLESHMLRKRGHTPAQAAQIMSVSARDIEDLVMDRRRIDRDLAARLAFYAATSPDYAGTTSEFWLSMQAAWDYAQRVMVHENVEGLWRAL